MLHDRERIIRQILEDIARLDVSGVSEHPWVSLSVLRGLWKSLGVEGKVILLYILYFADILYSTCS